MAKKSKEECLMRFDSQGWKKGSKKERRKEEIRYRKERREAEEKKEVEE